MIESLLTSFTESLMHGKASQCLEHTDAIELALEVGTIKTFVALAKRTDGPRLSSLTALIVVWQAKYDAIHGAD